MIVAYAVRHGETDQSPKPEWQSQIPLNELGKAQAQDAGYWLKLLAKQKPLWGVSSDLKRSEETLDIVAKILKIEVVRPMPELRALDKDEDQKKFEARNKKALDAILKVGKVKGLPLIACHRSNTAYIGKYMGNVLQFIDYRQGALVWEGGILELRPNVAVPVYRTMTENPTENMTPKDGTSVSGFVTDEDNAPPRDCGHCKWRPKGRACIHPVVTADDELGLYYGYVRDVNGHWLVKELDCCDFRQAPIKPIGGGA